MNYAIRLSSPPATSVLGLPSLAKSTTLRGISVSHCLEDSQLKGDVARCLQLAAMSHIYLIFPYIVRQSCLLARTTRVGVTIWLGNSQILQTYENTDN